MNKIDSIVINDNGFAFDPFTGETYTVNDLGITVLRLFRKKMHLVKIAEEISKEYQTSFESTYTDILEFRSQLRLYGLMV
jgi:hypothetical protein